MKTRKKQPLSIYIHIPFCKQKCLYCDFLSAPACGQERESYVKALLREISLMAESCSHYQIISIFFGGGTPSLLSKGQIKRILSSIRKNYELTPNAEISLECNPATASFEKLKAYRESGINRLSIGLQSANDRELKELGRIHNYRQFLHTYEAARKAGFTNINIDLMSALPGQTCESYEDTLQKVLALHPEHISAYSLIIEEGTPFFERYGSDFEESFCSHGNSENEENVQKKYPPLPDEDTERLMYHKTNAFLQKAGYERYEISNFAQEGYECRHNLTYWTGVDYIGFGVGAASYFQGFRYKNISDVKKYKNLLSEQKNRKAGGQEPFMPKQDPWHEEVQLLTMEEKMEEYMFLGLRLKKGISGKDFQKKFGKTVDEIYGNVITRFMKEGLLIQKGEWISLSKKGTDVANYVMAEFLLS